TTTPSLTRGIPEYFQAHVPLQFGRIGIIDLPNTTNETITALRRLGNEVELVDVSDWYTRTITGGMIPGELTEKSLQIAQRALNTVETAEPTHDAYELVARIDDACRS